MDPFELAARQHGAISLAQLRSLGVNDNRRRTLVDKGVLEAILPSVYRVRGAPSSWRLRLSAATLWVPEAMASHRASAALRGLEGFDHAPLEITSEYWTRRTRARGVRIHHTSDLVAADIEVVDGIQCTSLIRTLVDLPAVTHEMKAAIALDHAMRRNPELLVGLTARHLEVARRGRNGTAMLRSLLAERGDQGQLVDSGFERKFLRLVARGGLPTPVTQYMIEHEGVRCYLDAAWPDVLVAAECDSLAHHLSEQAFRWERRRRRMLELLGWKLLEFTYREVTREPARVLHDLERAIALASDLHLRGRATQI